MGLYTGYVKRKVRERAKGLNGSISRDHLDLRFFKRGSLESLESFRNSTRKDRKGRRVALRRKLRIFRKNVKRLVHEPEEGLSGACCDDDDDGGGGGGGDARRNGSPESGEPERKRHPTTATKAQKSPSGASVGYVPDRYNALARSRIRVVREVLNSALLTRKLRKWPFTKKSCVLRGRDSHGDVEFLVWVPELLWPDEFPYGVPACPRCESAERVERAGWYEFMSRRFVGLSQGGALDIKSILGYTYSCACCEGSGQDGTLGYRFQAWNRGAVKLMPQHIRDAFPVYVTDSVAIEWSIIYLLQNQCTNVIWRSLQELPPRILNLGLNLRVGALFVPLGSFIFIVGAVQLLRSESCIIGEGILPAVFMSVLLLHVVSIFSLDVFPSFVKHLLPKEPIHISRENVGRAAIAAQEAMSYIMEHQSQHADVKGRGASGAFRGFSSCSSGCIPIPRVVTSQSKEEKGSSSPTGGRADTIVSEMKDRKRSGSSLLVAAPFA